MKTIAYQGIQGAFSYLTALKEFGPNNDFKGLQTFREVFESIEYGHAACAVIPIENSLVGSIYENYDLLNAYDMHITAELFTKIEHCLLCVPIAHERGKESHLKTIKKVLSHPKALEQCSRFFQKYPWIEVVSHMDTAAAAAQIASMRDPTQAAIASACAGELYGLAILERSIEDDPKNYTRFVSIVKKAVALEQANKCSLLLKLKHVPGTLAELLKQFSDKEINLTKIESRPFRGSLFEYLFYVDFEFVDGQQACIKNLLNFLCDKVQKLKVLGFYKKGTLWIG